MRGGVDAAREPADDDDAARCEISGKLRRCLDRHSGCGARSDNCDRRRVKHFKAPAIPDRWWKIGKRQQRSWKSTVVPGDEAHAAASGVTNDRDRL